MLVRANIRTGAERARGAFQVGGGRVRDVAVVDRRAPALEVEVAPGDVDEARVGLEVPAGEIEARTRGREGAEVVAERDVVVGDRRRRAGRVRADSTPAVVGEDVVLDAGVVDAAGASHDDPARAGVRDGVADDHRPARPVVDLDPEAVWVIVDHVARDQMVVALEVDPVALLAESLAVVVDPVAPAAECGDSARRCRSRGSCCP